MRPLRVIIEPGPRGYGEVLAEQKARVAAILSSAGAPYVLHFLQHRPVLTLGRAFKEDHLPQGRGVFQRRGVEIVAVERGGSVTYHGPGQLVGYLHLHLHECGLSLRGLMRALEQWVMDFLELRGLHGTRSEGLTGVWVDGAKVSAIGIAASRFVSFHGFSLNLNSDLDLKIFSEIVPCGIVGKPVSRLQKPGGAPESFERAVSDLLAVLPPFLARLPREN